MEVRSSTAPAMPPIRADLVEDSGCVGFEQVPEKQARQPALRFPELNSAQEPFSLVFSYSKRVHWAVRLHSAAQDSLVSLPVLFCLSSWTPSSTRELSCPSHISGNTGSSLSAKNYCCQHWYLIFVSDLPVIGLSQIKSFLCLVHVSSFIPLSCALNSRQCSFFLKSSGFFPQNRDGVIDDPSSHFQAPPGSR